MNKTPIRIVLTWIDAVNDQDTECLAELSNSDMEFSGTCGSGHGLNLVLDWLARVGITLKFKRTFAREGTVVEMHGVWRSVETGEFVGDEDEAWRFEVKDNHVAVVERFDEINTALAAAGLQELDETEAA